MVIIPVKCRIPEHLHRIGKTQQWLADKTGIGETRISEYVNMKRVNMTFSRAMLIAHHLKCEPSALYVWEWRQE